MAHSHQELQSHRQANNGSLIHGSYRIIYVEPCKRVLSGLHPNHSLAPLCPPSTHHRRELAIMCSPSHPPLLATPYVPSLGRGPDMLETAQALSPHPTNDLSWSYMVLPVGTEACSVPPFEAASPNIPHVGADTIADLFLPDPPSNTFSQWNFPSVSNNMFLMGPGPSGTSVMPLQGQVEPLVQEHKYQCTMCQKVFDRLSRLENCQNLHANMKPHRCFGACGRLECPARYASIEKLKRHLNPHVLCTSCGKSRSKQNLARHKASCRGCQ